MATEWELLGSAIYSRLGSVVGSGTVPIYQDMAPAKTQPPYLIFQRMPSSAEYTFGTGQEVAARYAVRAVSDQQWADQAQATYGVYKPYMQDAPLSVDGYKVLRCRADAAIHYQDQERFWNDGDEYVIDMQKT